MIRTRAQPIAVAVLVAAVVGAAVEGGPVSHRHVLQSVPQLVHSQAAVPHRRRRRPACRALLARCQHPTLIGPSPAAALQTVVAELQQESLLQQRGLLHGEQEGILAELTHCVVHHLHHHLAVLLLLLLLLFLLGSFIVLICLRHRTRSSFRSSHLNAPSIIIIFIIITATTTCTGFGGAIPVFSLVLPQHLHKALADLHGGPEIPRHYDSLPGQVLDDPVVRREGLQG